MKKPVRIFPAPGYLATLVERPGGLPRSLAIIEGQRRLEAQRPPALAVIGGLIETLENLAAAPARLPDIRRAADQLITLATLYGLDGLAEAGRRLCDLVLALEAQQAMHGDAIAVHVRALRLLCADASNAPRILDELSRVRSHLQAAGPSSGAPGHRTQ